MSRRRAGADANQAAIVAALRAVGATVQLLHAVGGGCPDLLVGYRGLNHLLEVKNPENRYGRGLKSNRARSPERQIAWRACWRGEAHVVSTIDEAFDAIGLRRSS